jgi:hypothetical protein
LYTKHKVIYLKQLAQWPEFIRRRTPLTYDWPAFLPLSFPEILPVFRFRQEASFAATVVSAQSLPLICCN